VPSGRNVGGCFHGGTLIHPISIPFPPKRHSPMFRLLIISTGGTIEKTYCELAGTMANHVSVLDVMLASLQLPGVHVERLALMNKDSLEMTAVDHQRIVAAAVARAADQDGIVIVHGTDRLAVTGEALHARWTEPAAPQIPVVLTGAMRPYELRSSDALQNLTEAIMAAQLLPVGVYAVLHGQVLRFPGVSKDSSRGTFVQTAAANSAASSCLT